MKIAALQKKLVAAARLAPVDDRVPYAFEKRVMARLAQRPATDWLALWGRGLWRAAAPCIAVTLAFSLWTFYSAPRISGPDLAATDLETTVLAPLDGLGDTW
jgi:hypothetical protein